MRRSSRDLRTRRKSRSRRQRRYSDRASRRRARKTGLAPEPVRERMAVDAGSGGLALVSDDENIHAAEGRQLESRAGGRSFGPEITLQNVATAGNRDQQRVSRKAPPERRQPLRKCAARFARTRRARPPAPPPIGR